MVERPFGRVGGDEGWSSTPERWVGRRGDEGWSSTSEMVDVDA